MWINVYKQKDFIRGGGGENQDNIVLVILKKPLVFLTKYKKYVGWRARIRR